MVIADVHEEPSGIPTLLAELGVSVVLRPLPAGDFRVGSDALVERKTVLDLHGSLIKGRFWTQVRKLRAEARFPYLLIEGEDLDRGPLSARSLRGICVALLDLGVQLLWSIDARDSALWLERLAVRRQAGSIRNRPAYSQRPMRAVGAPAAEAALGAVPGISIVTARRLLSSFGTLRRVLEASEAEWRDVPGIGPIRAAALAATLDARYLR